MNYASWKQVEMLNATHDQMDFGLAAMQLESIPQL